MLPLERALYFVNFYFVILQFVIATSAVRRLIQKNTAEFYIMQESAVAESIQTDDGVMGINLSPTQMVRHGLGRLAGLHMGKKKKSG